MKHSNLISLFTIIFLLAGCNDNITEGILYIDENRPSLAPKIFAKDFITKDTIAEYGSVFNKDGSEFFFAIDSGGRSKIKHTSLVKGNWVEPQTIFSDTVYSYNDPFLSPDETKLYYISDMPRNQKDTIKDYDIWYSEQIDQTWSPPINAGPNINSDGNEYYISFTNDGSMYFSTNKENYEDRKHDFDIYKAQLSDGIFIAPQMLSDSINSGRYEADVFIAPDESYIIYSSARRSGYGGVDLYISFQNKKGQWTNSVNMGKSINTEGPELCPFVSKDGKYLFYTSNQDIYWVSTEILNLIKEKNDEL